MNEEANATHANGCCSNWFFKCLTHVQDDHSCWFGSYLKWATCNVLLAHVSGGADEHICDFTPALQAVTSYQ